MSDKTKNLIGSLCGVGIVGIVLYGTASLCTAMGWL